MAEGVAGHHRAVAGDAIQSEAGDDTRRSHFYYSIIYSQIIRIFVRNKH